MITNEETGELAGWLATEGAGIHWSEDPGPSALAGRLAARFGGGDGGGDGFTGRAVVAQEPPELVVPLSVPADEPAVQAAEFRRLADAIRAVLGEATFLGTHGFGAPYGRRTDPRWGRPFLRWRLGGTTLELRAGAAGPELVLQPSASWEDWYQSVGRGVTGTRESSGVELDHPRHEGPTNWEDLELTFAAFLRSLPAVTTALGVPLNLGLYGRIAGSGAPLLFGIVSDTRLYVDFTEYEVGEAARGERAAALGWTPREALSPGHRAPEFDGGSPWWVDAGGPGEVDAGAVASLIVRTARAAGVAAATDVVLGGEAEFRYPFRFAFPSLSIPVG
ncbi:hypothetical protein [Streptomyces sp. NPDC048623]|uniref:hypothetical protein n=1 Tax=Streptomyces sp. NPDC048623 TaxID=3155761 RepID=UPI00343A4298